MRKFLVYSFPPKQVKCKGAPNGRGPFGAAAEERCEHLTKRVALYK